MASQFEQIIAEISRIEAEVDEMILSEELEIQRLRKNSLYLTKVATALETNKNTTDELLPAPQLSTNIITETKKCDAAADRVLPIDNEPSSLSKLDEILQLAQRTREIRSSQSFPNDFTRRSISRNIGKVDFVNSSVSSSSVKSLRSSLANNKHSHHTVANSNSHISNSQNYSTKKALPIPHQQLKLMSGAALPPKPAAEPIIQPLSAFVDLVLNDLKQKQQQAVIDPILKHFEAVQSLLSHFVIQDKVAPSSSSLQQLHLSQARLLDKSPPTISWKSCEYGHNHCSLPYFPIIDPRFKKACQEFVTDDQSEEVVNLILQDVNAFTQLCKTVFSTPRLPSHKIPQLIIGWAKIQLWQQLIEELNHDSQSNRNQQTRPVSQQIEQLQLQLHNKMQQILISNLQKHLLGEKLLQIDEIDLPAALSAQFGKVSLQEWVKWCEHLKVARDLANEHKKSGKIMFQRRAESQKKK